MDLRTVGVTIACLLTLVGGMALGWVQGTPTSDSSVAVAAAADVPVQGIRSQPWA